MPVAGPAVREPGVYLPLEVVLVSRDYFGEVPRHLVGPWVDVVRVLGPLAVLQRPVPGDVASVGAGGLGLVVLVVEVVPASHVADGHEADVQVWFAHEVVNGQVPVDRVAVLEVVPGSVVQPVGVVHVVLLAVVEGARGPAHLGGAGCDAQIAIGIAHP